MGYCILIVKGELVVTTLAVKEAEAVVIVLGVVKVVPRAKFGSD